MTKPTKWHVYLAKTQISLGIRPVWSDSSLSAWRKLCVLSYPLNRSKNSDLTGLMPRLIWVFAGHTVILLVLSWGSSFCMLLTEELNQVMVILKSISNYKIHASQTYDCTLITLLTASAGNKQMKRLILWFLWWIFGGEFWWSFNYSYILPAELWQTRHTCVSAGTRSTTSIVFCQSHLYSSPLPHRQKIMVAENIYATAWQNQQNNSLINWVHSEGSDQTGRTGHFVGFIMLWIIWDVS